MGLLGGSRVDNITIVLGITIVLYTILVAGVVATFNNSVFVDPFGGKTVDIELGIDFENSQVMNITREGIINSSNEFTDFDPDRIVKWFTVPFSSPRFECLSKGYNFWDNWITFNLDPNDGFTDDEILEIYDEEENRSTVIWSEGGDLETYMFIYPRFWYNETESTELPIFEYDNLTDSFDAGFCTVILATNATFNEYGIADIFAVITGFDDTYFPNEISIIIGGIWWVLLILTVVKLVVG